MLSNTRFVIAIAVLFGAGCALCVPAWTQAASEHGKTAPASHPIHKTAIVYEDKEIRVVIPSGWSVVPESAIKRPDGPAMSLGNSVSQGAGKLILETSRYTLGIAYNTSHASGVEGGRFIEAFNIPWPGIDDAWTCSGQLREYPQPASRHLIFINLIVETGDEKVRENCAIQKELGSWREKDGQKEKEYDYGDRRWFGGYFTTEYGGYFFGGDSDGCGLKAYTLTSQATTPDGLPIADIPNQDNNHELEKTIQEAIDIVNSIQYKRCAPF
jgi:hypothetical protein